MIGNVDVGTVLDNDFFVIAKYGGEGKSGFGTVYIVYNDELNTALAMKTLQDKYVHDKESIKNFKKESLIWMELKHPNIVEAFGLDIIEDRLFIIMEPIFSIMGKQSLDDYFYEGLSDFKILDWAIQICYAMEYMEEKGIGYHGDIKPQNILIWENVIKITDFGLTNFINESEIINNKTFENYYVTNGKFCGTAAYMAPESFDGINNISTDIYSFGVVLFQMINKGNLPFNAESNLDKEWEELHKKSQIPFFNHILYNVVMKCLSKNPKDRYQSFKDLKGDLISIFLENFDGEPYIPKVQSYEKDYNYYYYKGNSRANVGDIENFIFNYEKAIELNNNSSDIRINYAINLIKFGFLDRALDYLNVAKRIFDEDNKNFVSLDRLYFNFGHAYQLKGYLNKAIINYEKSLEINENYIESYVNLGNIYKELQLYDIALEKYQLALDIDHNFFMAWINKGDAYSFLGNYEDSENCFYKAKNQEINEDLYYLWGQSLRRLNNELSALLKFFEILDINKESMYAYYNIVISYLILNNLDSAKEYFLKAIDLFGDNIEYKLDLSKQFFKYGYHEESLKILDTILENTEDDNIKALALFEKVNYYKDLEIDFAVSFLDEIIYSDADDELKSEACCDKALFLKDFEDFDRILEYFDDGLSFNSNNTRIHYIKGCFYLEIGNYALSIQTFDDGLSIDENHKGILLEKAWAHLHLEECFNCIECCDKYLEIGDPSSEIYLLKALGFMGLENYEKSLDLLNLAKFFVINEEIKVMILVTEESIKNIL